MRFQTSYSDFESSSTTAGELNDLFNELSKIEVSTKGKEKLVLKKHPAFQPLVAACVSPMHHLKALHTHGIAFAN